MESTLQCDCNEGMISNEDNDLEQQVRMRLGRK